MSPRVRRIVLLSGAMLLLTATSASTVSPATAVAPDPVITAVGDIACQSFSQSDGEGACRSDEVAALITRIAPDRFFALGDLQYNNGTLAEFLRVYDRQFGHLNPITNPTPGNHEYGDRRGPRGTSTTSARPRTGLRATTRSTSAHGTWSPSTPTSAATIPAADPARRSTTGWPPIWPRTTPSARSPSSITPSSIGVPGRSSSTRTIRGRTAGRRTRCIWPSGDCSTAREWT